MAVHHVTVTLTGAAQLLVPAPAAGTPSINCREVHIQNTKNNADVYVGGSTVSTTDYGFALVSSATAAAELVMRPQGHNVNLSSTYVIGTAAQVIHVLYIQ